jgi:hypothetical protein
MLQPYAFPPYTSGIRSPARTREIFDMEPERRLTIILVFA